MQPPTPTSQEDLINYLVNQGNGVKGLSQTCTKTIPPHFIQPPQERLDPKTILHNQSIPIIDLSNFEHQKVTESIINAASELGFFQVVNHGIPIQVLDSVREAAHRFFDLPVEERRKYLKENLPTSSVQLKTSFIPHVVKVLEWKDYLVHVFNGAEDEGTKYWPDVSREPVLEYMKWAKPLIKRILEVLLSGLNLRSIDKSKESLMMGTLIVTLLHYRSCPTPELTAGAGRHSDISTITILLQDDVGGLYVQASEDGDSWIHVTPVEGALVINIGDVLQILSNDRYKSIEHRVIVSADRNRVSVPIFVNPGPNELVSPLAEVLQNGEKALYKQVKYSDYFNYFFSKGHDGKHAIDFAKI